MTPTGTQYLVFEALDTLMLIRGQFFDSDSGLWVLAVLIPIARVIKLMPNGSTDLIEVEQ